MNDYRLSIKKKYKKTKKPTKKTQKRTYGVFLIKKNVLIHTLVFQKINFMSFGGP